MGTGTSVLGEKFDCGAVIAVDVLGSSGSLAHVQHLSHDASQQQLGASGDCANFQYLKQVFGQMVTDELLGDGRSYSSRAIHSWLTRSTYSRRSKMSPAGTPLSLEAILVGRAS